MGAIQGFIGLAGDAKPEFDRAGLTGLVDRYFKALARHDPAGLPLAKAVKFTENGKRLAPGEGFWKTAGAATYRMDVLDPEHGAAGVQTVVREGDGLVVLMARLKAAKGRL